LTALSRRIAEWTSRLSFKNLPETVVHEVKRRVIDSMACALGAFASEPGRIARETALAVRLESGATVIGTRGKSMPDLVTFANDTLVRYLDFNDTYLSKEPAHPSDNIAAALAISEAERRSGEEFITAVIVGYEIQCRLADAARLRTRGWDNVTYGVYSNACVASRLLRLSENETEHAISLAGVANNAMRKTRIGKISMWKACAAANAARNAVFAAYLARRGMEGPSNIFEGQFGFWELVSGPFDFGALGGDGTEPYRIMDSSLKSLPVEYNSMTAIEAAIQLRGRIPQDDEIAKIQIETFDACIEMIAGDADKWHPTTRETADHSLPYAVAIALLDGEVTGDSFEDKRIADPRLFELMQRVAVKSNAEMSAAYPKATPNEIQIQLRSGKELRARVDYPRGHVKNPMSDAEVEAKFRSLSNPYITDAKIEQILSTLWKLEQLTDLCSLPGMFAVDKG
jgi:2-methylcitrate dehydratase